MMMRNYLPKYFNWLLMGYT